MRKRIIFFAVLSFLFFLAGCSWKSLFSTSQESNYNNDSSQTDDSIKFEIVESGAYFSQQTGQSENLTSIKTILCDKKHNLVLIEVISTKTFDVAKRGLELSIFSASRQRNLRSFGLFCIFPDSIKINSLKIENGTATVDLNNEFFKQKYLDFYIKAITFYLTSFENIDRVYFYNEGRRYINKAFERKKAGQVIIFVPQKVSTEIFLIPKWIDIPEKFKNIPMTFAQKSLINSLSYRFSKLNGLKLNNVKIKENTLYIDLSKELLNLKGSSQVDIILSSICFTAREIDKTLKYLKISIDGKEPYLDQYDLKENIDMDQFKYNSLKIRL
ncbi:Lipoprotein LpqB, GerMN domain [Caldicellulosiruptor kronotskyensis 2002]|uniref:Lipoprotein LpqB, GerMN domain n=1 Tax=Caldicellulosiruptor kronotskyensis (strain DSM 18902 / VKM B-2412 / 2002) TaxID=632348 RepID=E4SFY8_CALK2|nr:GerMN domain-containing protein [Caldicellulosiruptor kronotskyensis]ADQ46663.1 Lipoprotein LpqB, GerMN domain [Caldicellulosiruptor kronotskyensis 2002]